jgi:AGCS family alanine or glycine:cation symporter
MEFIVFLGFIGASAPAATSVYFFSDPIMGVLALVNLITIIMLFPVGTRVRNDFTSQLKRGVEHPVFDPEKFPDLDVDPTVWDKN